MDMKNFKQKLLALESELTHLKSTNKNASDIVELDQAAVGRLSRMDALQAQAMAQETNRRNELELTRINSALQRIEDNNYGYCLRCDKEISENRLNINPAVTLCINCASQSEQN